MAKEMNRLAALAASSAKNWPLTASFIALGAATAVAAAPTLAAGAAIWAGDATTLQKVTFGLSINTAILATLVANNGYRMATLEYNTNGHGVQLGKLAKAVKGLTKQIQSLSKANSYELVPDSVETWARLAQSYRAIAPSLESEVQITLDGKGERRASVSKESTRVWLQRTADCKIEIVVPRGRMVLEDNVVSFRCDQIDLEQLRKLALFLRSLKNAGLKNTHNISIYVSDRGRYDLKSFFITHVKQQDGRLRKAAILYSNGLLPDHDGERLVAIHYGDKQLARAEARWSEMKKGSTRWTVDQLVNCFSPMLPEGDNGMLQTIPKDFQFDASDPFHQDNRDLEMVDTADGHFTFVEKRPTVIERATKVAKGILRERV